MDENTTTPPSVEPPAALAHTGRPRSRGRLVIPAAVVALALGTVGAGVGIGYAAADTRQQPATGATRQGTANTQVINPSYGGPGTG